MALTPEQETFLAAFADAGIAEQAAADARNAQIDLDTAIAEARAAKVADLEAQAQALIDAGIADFEANDVPNIKPAPKDLGGGGIVAEPATP